MRYAATRKEALEKLQELLGEQRAGLLAPPTSTTVADFLVSWLESAAPDLKPTTLDRYREFADRYVKPTLGHLKLQKHQPAHVVAAIARWRKKTSPGTVNGIYRALHRALALAVKWGLLARVLGRGRSRGLLEFRQRHRVSVAEYQPSGYFPKRGLAGELDVAFDVLAR